MTDHRPRALLLDSDPAALAALGDAFAAAGYAVTACGTGRAVRDSLMGGAFSVAVLDPQLGSEDGLALVAELHGAPALKGCPILLLSAGAQARTRILGLRAGAADYLGKPCDPTYVVERASGLSRRLATRSGAVETVPTVLVIGAASTARAAFEQALEAGGYAVLSADTGQRGLWTAAARHPDAIVVDAVPDLDTAAVIRQLRDHDAFRLTPCLFFAADPAAQLRALDAGGDECLGADPGRAVTRLTRLVHDATPPANVTRFTLVGQRLVLLAQQPSERAGMAERLRADGTDVVLAATAEEAAEYVMLHAADCLVICGAPAAAWTRGTCRALREAWQTREVPLVLLAQRSLSDTSDGALASQYLGADDCLDDFMPVDLLRGRIRAILRRRHLAEENRRLRHELFRNELDAAEGRSARALAEARAHLLTDLERKNAELSRVTAELRKLSVAVEQSPMAVVICDRAGRIEYVNPKLLSMLGYTAAELLGKTADVLVGKAPATGGYLEAFTGVGAEWRGEVQSRRKDGALGWGLVSISPIRDAAGNVTHFVHTQVDITQRHEAERALATNEERLSLILQTMTEGIVVVDPGGGLGFVNNAAARMLKLDDGGTPVFLQPDGTPLAEEDQPAARVFATGAPIRTLEVSLHLGASQRMMTINAAPLCNADGKVVAVLETLSDVTDRRRTEAKLGLVETQYRSLIENLPAIVYTLATDGTMEYISPEVERILGVSPAELLQSPGVCERMIHDEDRTRVLAAVAQAGTGPINLEYRMVRRDGGIVWLHDQSAEVHDAVHKVRLRQGVAFDITQRKEAEARLAEAEQQYRFLVEKLPAVVWQRSAAPPYKMLYLSPQVTQLYGYSAEELLADSGLMDRLRHSEDDPQYQAGMRRFLEEGGSATLEYRIRPRDGRVAWVRTEAVLVRGEDGRPLYIEGIHTDITERRRAEDALVIAKSEAEKASVAKSRFLATMSHELRTPLNAILGFSRVLDRRTYGELNERQLVYLRDISEAGEHMLRLVNDLLDLQRLHEGRDLLTLLEQHVEPILEDALRMIRPLALEKGHHLTVEVAAELPTAVTDKRALLQVLVNILTNAVKYTPAMGQIVLRARATGGHLLFEIQDSGIGISAADQERIFEYYEQVDSKHAANMSGSGIGLALTRALVQRLGGSIWVKSAPGEGSTFSFTLGAKENT